MYKLVHCVYYDLSPSVMLIYRLTVLVHKVYWACYVSRGYIQVVWMHALCAHAAKTFRMYQLKQYVWLLWSFQAIVKTAVIICLHIQSTWLKFWIHTEAVIFLYFSFKCFLNVTKFWKDCLHLWDTFSLTYSLFT